MTYGIFGTYLLNTEFQTFGTLPAIPYGYTLWDIKSDKDIDNVLNIMKIRNTEIDMKYPEESSGKAITLGDSSYDDECFLVILWFTDIFDYWFGKKNVKYISNPHMDAYFDDLCMNVWKWIRGEIITNTLKRISLSFYKEAIKETE